MPINTDSGFHTGLPRIVGAMPFQTKMDYQRYTSRLNDFPRYFDEQILLMKEGLKTGITIPKEVLNGYEKRKADAFIYPASLTKIMTAIVAFDLLKNGETSLDEMIVVSEKDKAGALTFDYESIDWPKSVVLNIWYSLTSSAADSYQLI